MKRALPQAPYFFLPGSMPINFAINPGFATGAPIPAGAAAPAAAFAEITGAPAFPSFKGAEVGAATGAGAAAGAPTVRAFLITGAAPSLPFFTRIEILRFDGSYGLSFTRKNWSA